jgi:hypothetical protein
MRSSNDSRWVGLGSERFRSPGGGFGRASAVLWMISARNGRLPGPFAKLHNGCERFAAQVEQPIFRQLQIVS